MFNLLEEAIINKLPIIVIETLLETDSEINLEKPTGGYYSEDASVRCFNLLSTPEKIPESRGQNRLIHVAAFHNNHKAVNILIEYGANPNSISSFGNTIEDIFNYNKARGNT